MRLWSIHPQYLDSIGLVACWREGLLARKVLIGETKGYKNHPQLERFKTQTNPVNLIEHYLLGLYEESTKRGYKFNRAKIGPLLAKKDIIVSNGQLNYELNHLKHKLKQRNEDQYQKIANINQPQPHPLFRVVAGGIAVWERNS